MKPPVDMKKPTMISNPHFRPGTQTEMKEWIFNLMMAGQKTAALGDMICWLPAIKFIAENYNFVAGHLIVPQWFLELAANIMRPFPHWRIHSKVPERLCDGHPLKQPMEHPVNATAMHLIDLGFLYFCGMMPPEGTNVYPLLDLEDVELHGEKIIRGPYVVMTPGATAENRKMLPSVYNAIVDHLLEKNITPVHLGVSEMKHRVMQPHFHGGYDLSKGINLIDKTTLLQAAKLMDEATMVIGIDNGLLHLAAMTDTTILIGYTMAGPATRRLYRSHGHTVELYGDKEKVPCLFCQEHVRFFQNHHFTNCIYKEHEPMCVKALNKESWIATIDQVLGNHNMEQQYAKAGDEVVLMYVILKREDWEKVKLPQGCYAKAFETGPIERMIEVQFCKGWGAMVAAGINRLAKKLCPEIANSNILRI